MTRVITGVLLVLMMFFLNSASGSETAEVNTVQETTDSATLPSEPAKLESISIKPSKWSILTGKNMQFNAVGNYSDNTTRDLTDLAAWSSSNEKIAEVNEHGVATAGNKKGTITIKASFEGKTGHAKLKVAPGNLLSISIDPVKPAIAKGMTQQFVATGSYSDDTTRDLTSTAKWESWDNNAATINSNGLANGKVKKGAATITATYRFKRGMTKIILNPRALVSIAVTPETISMFKGTTQQFIATGSLADKTFQSLTSSVTWTSSDPSVATVDAHGLAAILKKGTTTITAITRGKKGSSSVTVVPRLVSISVTPSNKSIRQMEHQQFKVTGFFDDDSTVDLTSLARWTSERSSVAPINGAGLATGIDLGSSRIFARYEDKSASTQLTVLMRVVRKANQGPATGETPDESSKWPAPRFTNADGTTPALGALVLDQTTGLLWPADAATPGPAACAPAVVKTWQDALEHVACLNRNNYLGHNDWRVPTRQELFSLVDYEQSVPAKSVYTSGFSYVQLFYGRDYWLSSASNPAFADLSYGTVYYGNKSFRSYVWPVRAGKESPIIVSKRMESR